jgi:hypothetical protein
MSSYIPNPDDIDPKTLAFYRHVLKTLNASEVPFLVGGTYAFKRYTEIARQTKDLDIFVRPKDCDRVFDIFAATGCTSELSFPHWLGKVFCNEDFVDVIFNSANGNDEVDDVWFERAVEEEVFGIPVKLCSPEEIIRSKAFVMERERYDGADVAHLLRSCSEQLDWSHLLARFGSHWRVLLSHLILFGFIYPAERDRIPNWVMQELLRRLESEMSNASPTDQVCQGTLLSRAQYLVDTESWGYQDARLCPRGNMTVEDVAQWTAALHENQ